MSATIQRSPWKCPIGRPNCSRSPAYRDGGLEGSLGEPERDRRRAEPLAVVGRHEPLEAAGGEEQVLAGDPAAVEDDLALGDAAHPHRPLAPRDGQSPGVSASTISAPIPAGPGMPSKRQKTT